jgi:hypothetical protein
MDMRHAAMIWRQSNWYFRAFKNQNWMFFSCLRLESMHLLYRWTFAWILESFLGEVGATGSPWNRPVS